MTPTRLRPTAIIFDLDGVLLDSERLWMVAFANYAAAIGRQDSSNLFDMALGRRRVDCLPDIAAAVDRPPEEVECGLSSAMEALVTGGHLKEMPFAQGTVRRLARDWTLGLASSSVRQFVDDALDLIEIRECFEHTLSGDEVLEGKPHPEMYLAIAELLDVPPSDCVAIEDSAAGVAAAAAAGMTCVGVHFRNRAEAQPDYLVPDLRGAEALFAAKSA